MDCQSCQPSLVDLIYGELAPDVAEAAREHLDGCEACSATYRRLQAGYALAEQLPIEEPPQRVSAHLLQLAEDYAAEAAKRTAASDAHSAGPWAAFAEFIGRFAMAPQVGMATIMLLIVAVGLWSVPQLSRSPEVAGDTVINPDYGGDATASQGVRPAEPLDLRVDMRRRRIRSKDDAEGALAGAPTAPGTEAAKVAPPADPASAPAEHRAEAGDELAELDLDDLSDITAPRRAAGEGPAASAAAARLGAPATDKGGPVGLREQEGAVAQAFPATGGTRGVVAPETKAAPAAPAAPRDGQRSADGALSNPYAKQRRASRGASNERMALSPAPPAAAPTADAPRAQDLEKARATRRSSGCAAALPLYERVVAGAGRTRTTGEALIEMAECQRELGRAALARSLLEGAAKVPAVAARARRLLGPVGAPAAVEAAPSADRAPAGAAQAAEP